MTCALAAPLRASGDLPEFQVVQEEEVTKHVRYRELNNPAGPVRMFVVSADLKDPATTLVTTLARDRVLGLEGTSAQTARANGANGKDVTPLAAVNADFFKATGDPVSVHVLAGEIVSSHQRSHVRAVFAMTPQEKFLIEPLTVRATLEGAGKPLKVDAVNEAFVAAKDSNPPGSADRDGCPLVIYTPRYGAATPAIEGVSEAVVEADEEGLRTGKPLRGKVRETAKKGGTAIPGKGFVVSAAGSARAAVETLAPGRVLSVSAEIPEARGQVLQEAVGGGPRMLRGGKVSVEGDSSLAAAKHPRTAAGWDAQGRLALVVVDGRQAGWSAGITLNELAALMLEMGCREAVNLDGGGSSTMWVKGEIKNKPSDKRERPVANALVVVESR